MAEEFLAVSIDEDGVIHTRGEKLIVGDFDFIKAAIAAWGGNRQRGRIEFRLFLKNQRMVNTSPDFNGTFAEGSEPSGGLG
jgi:hypothetical protein